MRKGMSLTVKLILVTLLEITLLFAAILIYQVSLTRKSYEEAHLYSQFLCNQTAGVITTKTKAITRAAQTMAYFKNTEQYLLSKSVSEKLEIQPAISSMAQYIIESNEDIVDITLVDMDRNLISYNNLMDSAMLSTMLRSYPGMLTESQLRPFYSAIISQPDKGGVYYSYVLPVYSLASNERIGTCVVLCNGRNLLSLLQALAPNGNYVIKLKYSANNRDMASINSSVKPEDPAFFINVIAGSGLYMQSTLDITALPNANASMVNMLFLFGSITVFIVAVTALIMYFGFTKPLRVLLKRLNKIGSGGYKRLEPIRSNELGKIAGTINNMLDEIDTNTTVRMESQNKLYEAELNMQRAKFYALQSQINPHFLYNTLECMRSIGLVHGIREIVEISLALSGIFRYSIKGNNIVQVCDEIDIIVMYLRIMSIRFDDKFTILWDIPEAMKKKYMMKMILQPIVENAVYHGLEPKDGPGTLKITGCIEDDNMIFEVSDDGIGMEEECISQLNATLNSPDADAQESKRSIGLKNIHDRIRLFFGEQYGLSIVSVKSQGTAVTVRLPLQLHIDG